MRLMRTQVLNNTKYDLYNLTAAIWLDKPDKYAPHSYCKLLLTVNERMSTKRFDIFEVTAEIRWSFSCGRTYSGIFRKIWKFRACKKRFQIIYMMEFVQNLIYYYTFMTAGKRLTSSAAVRILLILDHSPQAFPRVELSRAYKFPQTQTGLKLFNVDDYEEFAMNFHVSNS